MTGIIITSIICVTLIIINTNDKEAILVGKKIVHRVQRCAGGQDVIEDNDVLFLDVGVQGENWVDALAVLGGDGFLIKWDSQLSGKFDADRFGEVVFLVPAFRCCHDCPSFFVLQANNAMDHIHCSLRELCHIVEIRLDERKRIAFFTLLET